MKTKRRVLSIVSFLALLAAADGLLRPVSAMTGRHFPRLALLLSTLLAVLVLARSGREGSAVIFAAEAACSTATCPPPLFVCCGPDGRYCCM